MIPFVRLSEEFLKKNAKRIRVLSSVGGKLVLEASDLVVSQTLT